MDIWGKISAIIYISEQANQIFFNIRKSIMRGVYAWKKSCTQSSFMAHKVVSISAFVYQLQKSQSFT